MGSARQWLGTTMGPRERGAGFVVEDPLAMIRSLRFTTRSRGRAVAHSRPCSPGQAARPRRSRPPSPPPTRLATPRNCPIRRRRARPPRRRASRPAPRHRRRPAAPTPCCEYDETSRHQQTEYEYEAYNTIRNMYCPCMTEGPAMVVLVGHTAHLAFTMGRNERSARAEFTSRKMNALHAERSLCSK